MASELLTDDVDFKGTFGSPKKGREAFLRYMRTIQNSLHDHRGTINDLIVSGNRAAAYLRFQGFHQGPLLGFEPTKVEIMWHATAFFTVRDGKLSEIKFLGDVDDVKRQLNNAVCLLL